MAKYTNSAEIVAEFTYQAKYPRNINLTKKNPSYVKYIKYKLLRTNHIVGDLQLYTNSAT